MFERFTERARQVVVLAQDEARALKHDYIGTEHILLGLLREGGLATNVLESLGVRLEEARSYVARIAGKGDGPVSGQIPFTPGAKRVLELSLREALTIGDNYIGTEHILLGLVRVDEGVAAEILLELGVSPETVRDEVVQAKSSGARTPEGPRGVADATGLLSMLEHAKRRLTEEQRVEEAARLRDKQRRAHELLADIKDDVWELFPDGLSPSARGPDAARWEYAMKALKGPAESWPEQLSEWRRDGWEPVTFAAVEGVQQVLLERRT